MWYPDWEKFIDTFLDQNQKINLSAIRTPEDVYTKHILDSLELNSIFKFEEGSSVIDIGTWWGFPLLPLAITNPLTNFIGLDSVNKKLTAIKNMSDELQIKNIKLIWSRAEQHNLQYDYLTARAVWYIDVLIKFWFHLVKKWWFFIFYKMFSEEEHNDIQKICKYKRLNIFKIHKYTLWGSDIQRVIYILKK